MTQQHPPIGIVSHGLYLPEPRMTAADVAAATGGQWSEDAVRTKLGSHHKPVPGPADGTQEMAVHAARDCLKRGGVDATEIDLILCIGEEHKEYALTTSGIYVQEKIGASNAWAIDLQQRCNTTVAALKIAKDMLIADDELTTVLIVGGYRNGDLIDYEDAAVSFMFNLGAGAGAFLLRKGHDRNEVLGTHIITDGSMARDTGVELGGTVRPYESWTDSERNAVQERGNRTLRVFDPSHMKSRLNAVSFSNWMLCLDRALAKSSAAKPLTRTDIDFLNVLHFKPSMYRMLLDDLGLTEDQAVYLDNFGHIGQVDQMIVVDEGLKTGRLRDGMTMALLAAGIGYVWGATIVRWGPVIRETEAN